MKQSKVSRRISAQEKAATAARAPFEIDPATGPKKKAKDKKQTPKRQTSRLPIEEPPPSTPDHVRKLAAEINGYTKQDLENMKGRCQACTRVESGFTEHDIGLLIKELKQMGEDYYGFRRAVHPVEALERTLQWQLAISVR